MLSCFTHCLPWPGLHLSLSCPLLGVAGFPSNLFVTHILFKADPGPLSSCPHWPPRCPHTDRDRSLAGDIHENRAPSLWLSTSKFLNLANHTTSSGLASAELASLILPQLS